MKATLAFPFFLIMIFIPIESFAQQSNESKRIIHTDSSLHSFVDFFQKGKVQGQLRNYFMATINEGELRDYWTNATGGALKFETAEWYGFQLGFKGRFTYQSFSSDLNQLDSLVGKSAKWEKELYDINRPHETQNLDHLQELYLKFKLGHSFFQFGKIDINKGPLFLRRDGRMNPFVYRGFWSEFRELKEQKITLGLINGVSPRGMTEWLSLNEAIGILNNGIQPNGSQSLYHETSGIKHIVAGGYEIEKIKSLKLQVWNYYFQRQSNITWVQADLNNGNFLAGFQYVHQHSLNYQNELSYKQRYIQPGEKAHIVNLLAGYQNAQKSLSISGNYFHSFGSGRFLFPKELGRENFYATDARSWLEGLGGTSVYMLSLNITPTIKNQKPLSLHTKLSRVETSNEARLNKYGTASYSQLSVDSRVKLSNKLQGVSCRLLYITRLSDKFEGFYEADKFYKSNYHHINLITNIEF